MIVRQMLRADPSVFEPRSAGRSSHCKGGLPDHLGLSPESAG